MKLNKEQILKVKNFVSSHGIRYYDVQLEIIDHVACKVEELMTANATVTLNEAIAQTYAGFGVTGFKIVEDTMRKSLQKRYWKLFRTIFLSYLKPVYLPLEAGLVYLLYLLAKRTNSVDLSVDITWILLLSFILVQGIYRFNNSRNLIKNYKQRMLTVQMAVIVTSVVNLPLQLFILFFLLRTPSVFGADATAIICGVFLTIVIMAYFTMKQIKKIVLNNCRELEEQYRVTTGS